VPARGPLDITVKKRSRFLLAALSVSAATAAFASRRCAADAISET